MWARTQGIPTPPNDRWSLASALDATDLFLVSVMGLDFFDGGVRVHSANGWEAVYWDATKNESSGGGTTDPFENLDSFGPTSKAGRDFIEALEAHNKAFGQPAFAPA